MRAFVLALVVAGCGGSAAPATITPDAGGEADSLPAQTDSRSADRGLDVFTPQTDSAPVDVAPQQIDAPPQADAAPQSDAHPACSSGIGAPCCETGGFFLCFGALGCDQDTHLCADCGEIGQLCCDTASPPCGTGIACSPWSNICTDCGTYNGHCCNSAQRCDPGLSCIWLESAYPEPEYRCR